MPGNDSGEFAERHAEVALNYRPWFSLEFALAVATYPDVGLPVDAFDKSPGEACI